MESGKLEFGRSLFAGAIAGLSVDLSLYPLDTIKTRIQSQQGFQNSGGFKHIYRGMSSVALGSAPGSALFFSTYTTTKKLMNCQNSPLCEAFCASFGEIMACLVRVPTEIIKQRAQIKHLDGQKDKTWSIAKKIYSSNGIKGFYRGYSSTVFREIPFSFIQFPLWEYLKRRRQNSKANNALCTPLESALCGCFAGSFAAAVTTPLDVIKTRIMLSKSSDKGSIMEFAKQIIAKEGVSRLYSGILPRSLWMGVGGFIFFFSYEFSMNFSVYLVDF